MPDAEPLDTFKTFRSTPALAKDLEDAADREDRTQGAVIRRALRAYFDLVKGDLDDA